MIRTIEELSLNAWPSVHTLLLGGWVLRFAGGYTRRANSVIPLYPVEGDVGEQIAACEALYHAQGLPVIFKMTSACTPPDLDDRLAARGYAFDAHTSVQVLGLKDRDLSVPANLDLSPQAEGDWQAAFNRMHHLAGETAQKHGRILAQILPQTAYAALAANGQIAACGLGVLQDGYLGLFDVITDEGQRRRGYARQLMEGLLAWGQQQGAHTAYLQVMLNNPPALALYTGLGFREAYRYWYRVKP
jgi:ribosomal protein S18 acetylase RimI-like enzyme